VKKAYPIPDSKNVQIKNIKKAVDEVKSIKAGQLKSQPLSDFLNEL
jgi:hypothetical protein